jgi:hypothetical protein
VQAQLWTRVVWQTSISVVPPAFVNLIVSVPKDFDPAKLLPLPQLREAKPGLVGPIAHAARNAQRAPPAGRIAFVRSERGKAGRLCGMSRA